ncbi:MAG: MFS transporter [Pirellulales bacterium]
MNTRNILILLLAICTAHAMVHMYELALPSVELSMANDYQVETVTIGWMSFLWRMPWGFGALVAGFLVDRYGARRLLSIFLIGCGVCCCIAALAPPLSMMMVTMFVMGTFACIYHPAGLALLSHEIPRENLPKALGWHGVFGSAGIGAAPFIMAAVLVSGGTWHSLFWVLALPGFLVGGYFVYLAKTQPESQYVQQDNNSDEDSTDWTSFGLIATQSILLGFTYAGVLSFLPRYLSESGSVFEGLAPELRGNLLGGGILFIGCIGQYLSGYIARREKLESQLFWIALSTVPCLLAMAFVPPSFRPLAAGVFALTFFMHQPVQSSLVAEYTPKHRRSFCYGIMFALANGVGGIGAIFAGYSAENKLTYSVFAISMVGATLFNVGLWYRNRGRISEMNH